jgi:hypothetical protein
MDERRDGLRAAVLGFALFVGSIAVYFSKSLHSCSSDVDLGG